MRERDPFANFDRMRREIDELLGEAIGRGQTGFQRAAFVPRADVYLCGDPERVIVKLDLAGIDPGAVGLEIRGRQLVVEGVRHTREREGRRYQQIEIEHGAFRRVVDLPADVAAEGASASYDDGILRVEIPLLRHEPRRRRVPIAGRGDEPDSRRGGDGGSSA